MVQQVVVERPNKAAYKTDFYSCMRCSVMFLDPDQFARLGIPVRRWAGDVFSKTLEDALKYWNRTKPE